VEGRAPLQTTRYSSRHIIVIKAATSESASHDERSMGAFSSDGVSRCELYMIRQSTTIRLVEGKNGLRFRACEAIELFSPFAFSHISDWMRKQARNRGTRSACC
jgi:hypothetical protein